MARTLVRALAGFFAAAMLVVLAACSGLPTSGDVRSGLALGTSPDDPDILPQASGPIDGAGPQRIVEDFIEAAITPTDNWQVAQSFLTPAFRSLWRPAAGVLIDEGKESRIYTAPGDDVVTDAADGDTVEIDIAFDQVAVIDETGAYSEAIGGVTLPFVVEKTDGQWRIAQAPHGIVLDQARFPRVYDDYPLQYFDQSWTRLIPDVRWLPRRATIATTITQSLIEGAPSPWLDPAVQSAFPSDVTLARDAVPIDSDQVAEVALSRSAQQLDPVTLARMRTQLQETLDAAGVQVSQVRFLVDGRALDAGVVKVEADEADSATIAMKEGAFGTLAGSTVTAIGDISGEIEGIAEPIAAVDVAVDDSFAAVHLADGRVYRAASGQVDELDAAVGLISPSVDVHGFIWTVPSNAPAQTTAWQDASTAHQVADAWKGMSAITAMRVSADGVRVAAVVDDGGQIWVAVAAVIRDDSGAPTALGEPRLLAEISTRATDLVWLGPDRLGVLVEEDGPKFLTQIVGGPGSTEVAPVDAVSLAGASNASSVRVLSSNGSLFSRSGSAWREIATGVTLLATRSGH
ncbi:LpqB family beta-propeller domain-containing protein [Microbacterium sp.]|uniref:LpqB family beta-propeller domain-containing protein n=1 Tax=Microbacterium sp. TaxID=51671 RepID=UPI0039E454BE